MKYSTEPIVILLSIVFILATSIYLHPVSVPELSIKNIDYVNNTLKFVVEWNNADKEDHILVVDIVDILSGKSQIGGADFYIIKAESGKKNYSYKIHGSKIEIDARVTNLSGEIISRISRNVHRLASYNASDISN